MKKYIYLILLFMQINVFAQNGWNVIYTFQRDIDCFAFKDSLTGIAVSHLWAGELGDSQIYKTTDGGVSWNEITVNGFYQYINKIIYIGKNSFIGVGEKGTVIKSTDAGNSWDISNVGDTLNLGAVCTTIDGKLFCCSMYYDGIYRSSIYKSLDNGASWTQTRIDSVLGFSFISFVNSDIGFVVGDYETFKTTNGGETWLPYPSIITGQTNAIKFINERVGYAAGSDIYGQSKILKTEDGGGSWSVINSTGNTGLHDITYFGENFVWIVGADNILFSYDAGKTWIRQIYFPYKYLFDAECIDSLKCFILGDKTLYKTTTGGLSAPTLVYPKVESKDIPLTTTLICSSRNDAKLFRFQIAKDQDFRNIISDNVETDTLKLIDNLELKTRYYWRVREEFQNIDGPWSFPSTFITTKGAPLLSIPENNTIDIPLQTMFSWSDVSLNANTYQLEIATDSSFANLVYDDSTITNDSLTISQLSDSVLYYWRVRAKINDTYGAWSDTWHFQTMARTPHLIFPINNTFNIPANTTFKWSEAIQTTNYILQISTDSLFGSNIVVNYETINTSLEVPLKFRTKYYWRIGAKNLNEKIYWSNTWIFTTGDKTSALLFPLYIGNKWYYQAGSTRPEYYYGVVKEVTDTLSNGFREITSTYYYSDSTTIKREYWAYLNGKFYFNTSPTIDQTKIYFDNSITKDTCIPYTNRCWHLVNYTIFNRSDTAQEYTDYFFSHGYGSSHWIDIFPNVGIVETQDRYSNVGSYYIDSTYLVGIYRNGEIIGDTTLKIPPTFNGTGWSIQNSGTTSDLYSISFSDRNDGIVVGAAGIILRTTNGGATWNKQSGGTTENLYGVYFTDKNSGTIVGERGTILRTTDGGITWTPQSSGNIYSLSAVFFTDKNNGTAVGPNGYILKTTNGGTEWDSKFIGNTNLNAVCFTDTYNGIAVGDNGEILRTSNDGTSWDPQTTGISNKLYDVFFVDKDNGTIVGENGTIFRTTNRGITWVAQTSGTINYLESVYFTDLNNGITVGYGGKILRTTNSGTTWLIQKSGISNVLNDVTFTDLHHGWIVGSGGLILNSSDNDSTNSVEITSSPLFPMDNATAISRTIELKWKKVYVTESYELQISADSLFNQILYDYKNLQDTSLTIDSLNYSCKYYWRIITLSSNGEFISQVWNFTTESLPKEFRLYQNYPNPFNPGTKIKYDLPKAGHVTIKVYDILGRKVETLINEEKPAGNYEVEFSGSNLSSGIYFYELQAGNYSSVKKMILIK